MAYVCKVCGFVLEEDELPEDYVCPVCGVSAANFEEQ
jgi:rubredoxin